MKFDVTADVRDSKGRFIKGTSYRITHGDTKGERTKEYKAWVSMKSRCHIPSATGYHRYGGMGISVCERWRKDFKNFLADMGRAPSLHHSLDRINCRGNYEPGNCRWADLKTQGNNKRNSVRINIRERSFCVSEVCERYGIKRDALRSYIGRQAKKGMRATYTEAFFYVCLKMGILP